MHSTKVGYRPDIDGLRAIAVIAVILYHFKFGFVSGGFVGVDIFFVISGYLITKVIIEQERDKRFSFADFYLRRVRRLVPALLATVAASYVAAFFLFSPSDFTPMSASVIYAVTGTSNIFFWLESGYFDAASALKPLLHTWSLGVEIQFYILWPALLFFITRVTKRPMIAVVVVLLIGAVAANYYIKSDASGAFFLTPFRIHEFLFGGLVVFLERYKIKPLISHAAYLVGLALVSYSIFTFSSESTLFPGLAALVPTLGAALMILGGKESVLATAFSTTPAVKIGEISYSLYLVHWPLFVFVSYVFIGEIGTLVKVGLVSGTVVLALMLYYLIEKPFRHQRGSRISGEKFSVFTAFASILVIIPAATSWAQKGWEWRVPLEIREMVQVDQRSASIYVFEVIKRLNEKQDFDMASDKPKLLVIGDSQAGDLLNILTEQGYTADFNVVSRLVDSACATPRLESALADEYYTRVNPIVIKDPIYIERCKVSLARANDKALLSHADKIFIAMYWRDFAEPYYLDAINKIAAQTKAQVYVFGRKDLLKDSTFIATSLGRAAGLSRYATRYRNPETDKINRPLELLKNIIYVDLMQATCPTEESCLVLDENNKPAFFNATHLSKEGAKLFGPRVRSLLEEAGRNNESRKITATSTRN